MNYEPNNILWAVGALVIHDDDSKEPEMLMRVTAYNKKTGEFRTRYTHPDAPRQWKNKIWRNNIKSLHDPARFEIKVSNNLINTRSMYENNHADRANNLV